MRKRLSEREVKEPIHIHIGCGRLAVGAVIPFLHWQLPRHRLFFVQRTTRWWAALEDNSYCYLRNTAGFFKSYKVWKPATPEEIERKIIPPPRGTNVPTLLLVPHLGYVTSLLRKQRDRRTTISCSLSKGQEELAATLLDVSSDWCRLLLFENTPNSCWSHPALKCKTFQVVVDRICWDLSPVNNSKGLSGGSFPLIECVCERVYSSFQWEKGAGLSRLQVNQKSFGFHPENSFDEAENIELAVNKKRALINATHAILSILCCRLLAKREMDTAKQYLAPLQALLKNDFPEWHRALDTYIRMRCIEMAVAEFELIANKRNKLTRGMLSRKRHEGVQMPQEVRHALFDANYRIAKQAEERFLKTEDSLGRLISAESFMSELHKYDEHIVRPFADYQRKQEEIESWFTYRRPDRVEITHLKDFLNDSFLQAMKMLSKQQKQSLQEKKSSTT